MPDLIFPDDPRYALSRTQFIGRPRETLPRAVVRCADTDAVVEALAWARRAGWPFAVRGGGHSNACHSSTDGLLIDLTPHDAIEVSGEFATVGAGVRAGDLAAALGARVVPLGSCPSVGVVGAALGGGFGSHGRLHGLTCDALVSAAVVLADGRVVDTADEPDLLWALRGAGGGNFGVVTAATFRTAPAAARTHFRVVWPVRHAAALLRWWQRWDADDAVSAEMVLLCPQYPDEEPTALLVGAAPDRAAVDAFLAATPEPAEVEIVDLSPADAARLRATPYAAAAHDPASLPLTNDRPGMHTAKTEFFDHPLPDEALAALLEHFTARREYGELREIAFTPWRGAYARVPGDATAFAHRTPAFLVKHTVLVGPVGAARRGQDALAWLARSWALTHPWGTGAVYPNFPDPALPDWLTAYYGPNVDRLRALKRRYDPDNAFRFAQSIPP
ncbi:FAD-binding oxidoreductase [Actinokineospora sp. NPDC004072]